MSNNKKQSITINKEQSFIDQSQYEQNSSLWTFHIESLVEFFCGKRKKINIWTYLFKELYQSLDRILRMCEIEQKVAFCQGVRDTLKNSIKSLDKIEHKIKLEQNQESFSKNCAWDVPFLNNKTLDQLLIESGYEKNFKNLIQDEEESVVEYQLLNELVQEGKMNLVQAMVLIIRERAKIQKKKIKKDKLEEQSEVDYSISIQKNENQRGYSTPNSGLALLSRVNLKLKTKVNKKQQKKNKEQKQEQNTTIQIDKEKLDNNNKNEYTNYKMSKINKKMKNLENLKIKATEHNLKPSDAQFLIMLEQQCQNVTFDPKIDQTNKKRIKIMEDFNKKLKFDSSLKTQTFLTNKQKIEQEKREKLLKRLEKLEQAEERRKIFQEQKIKQSKIQKQKNLMVNIPILKTNNRSYFVAQIFQEKNKLDEIFENFEEKANKLKIIDNDFQRSKSFDAQKFTNLFDTYPDEITSDQENISEEIKKQKKRSKKRKKQNNIQDQKNTEQRQKLSKYYKFLTKDLEFLEEKKRLQKKQKKFLKKQKSLINNEQPAILEYAELISKEVAKNEKNKLKQNKYNYCTLCKQILEKDLIHQHLTTSKHQKIQQKNGILDSIIQINESELNQQRFLQLKKRCKKVKRNIEQKSLEYEKHFVKNENVSSVNKTRLNKLILDLEIVIFQQKKDYKQIQRVFQEINRIIDKYQEADLIVLRTSRFINVFIDFVKISHIIPKFELNDFIRILDNHLNIIQKFCVLPDNRKFLLQTNKVIPLMELLSWSWSHSVTSFSCLNYIPQLIHLITFLLQQKLDEEYIVIKKDLLEYICYCGVFKQIKQKFTIFQVVFDEEDQNVLMINIILKTLKLLDIITSQIYLISPILQKIYMNVLDNILFVLEQTEIGGCLHLLASILLSGGSIYRSIKDLPQPSLVFAYFVFKILNNLARINIETFQKIINNSNFNADQYYHVVLYLFAYCNQYYGKKDEIFQVLQEVLINVGYFAYNNVDNKVQLARGTEKHTIVFKLAHLPKEYYTNNFLLRELLFPTLMNVIDDCQINAKILLNELDKKLIIQYVQDKIKLFDQQNDWEIINEYSIKTMDEILFNSQSRLNPAGIILILFQFIFQSFYLTNYQFIMKKIIFIISIVIFIYEYVSQNENEKEQFEEYNNPGLRDFTLLKGLGLLCNLLANILTNYIGVTGSGLVYSIFIFLFGFETKQAIPIYKMCNLMASVFNIVYVFQKRQKKNQNKLELEWDLASFCLPFLFSGSMIGIIISSYYPGFYLLLIIAIVLAIGTLCKTYQIFNPQRIPEESPENEPFLQNSNIEELNQPISLWQILMQQKKEIFIIIFSLLLLIFGNIAKGSELHPSKIFQRCSTISFVVFFGCMLIIMLLGCNEVRSLEDHEHMSDKNIIFFAFLSFISGTITSFGISGSLIFATGLSLIHIPPSSLTTLTRLSLFSSSLAAVLQFFIDGYLDVFDSLIISITSLIGSYIGLYLYHRDSKKGIQKNKNNINYVLLTILTLSIILMPFIMNNEVKYNPNAFKFGKIC